ncbi:BCD family MFS transporter [Aurantimonas sp. 22II-16-19i]|uniref:BCD family MFS transporter n=1 Tax=Aurantimonas sp. 22II-16-19i TaxID=1317114 RepID=UPI0009F7AF4D|nr:BCD family MFS transporter [Aurantimonas sp. 22II-16-19i]ORE92741.1 light harvesting pigment MFS transporter Bch2 [Aurantimonas sp. 22II-16-19i]
MIRHARSRMSPGIASGSVRETSAPRVQAAPDGPVFLKASKRPAVPVTSDRPAVPASGGGLTWLQIVRLALVQTALGAMVVLTTSTMNRVMVVELALPAIVPGALVAIHYALQMLRPAFGHGSDGGRRRTPFIVGGMAVLGLGAVGAAAATALMSTSPTAGILAAMLAFVLIGAGVGAAGTNLLTLVATQVAPHRRGPAATLIWIMMIAGFAVTTGLAGQFLDPYSPARLVAVTATVCAIAFLVSLLAVAGVETSGSGGTAKTPEAAAKPAFRVALAEIWAEAETRRFTILIFVSMLAYSAQDLVLEPFAGLVFAMTPGETTALSSAQHGGTVLGMVLVALAAPLLARRLPGILTGLCVAGCLGSALALGLLATSGFLPGLVALTPLVFALGLCNGVFAVAAIARMMGLAREGAKGREGVRMGVWGASQAIAFGLGGFLGTVAVDLTGQILGQNLGGGGSAYAFVFGAEALLFILSARLALRAVTRPSAPPASSRREPGPSSSDVVPA